MHTFDPQKIRGKYMPSTWVLFDPTLRDLFLTQSKKIEKFVIYGGNFPNQA